MYSNNGNFANFSYLRKLDYLFVLKMTFFILTFFPLLSKLVLHGENVVTILECHFRQHVVQFFECRRIGSLRFASPRYFRALIDCIS